MRTLIILAIVLFSLTSCAENQIKPTTSSAINGSIKTLSYCRNLLLDLHSQQDPQKPKPIVMDIHGGGWETGDRKNGFEMRRLIPLLQNNFLVATLDYRLAPENKHPAQIHDVKCAIKYLKHNASTLGIDPERFGLMGESAGGHLASLAGLTNALDGFDGSEFPGTSTQVKAVAAFYGLHDVVNVEPSLARISVANNFTDRESKINGSPVVYIDEEEPPFLILHGKEDKFVDVAQSVKLALMLKDKGHEPLLVVVENAGHGFVERGGKISPSNAKMDELLVAFFTEYLK